MENKVRLIKVYTRKMQETLGNLIDKGCNGTECNDCPFSCRNNEDLRIAYCGDMTGFNPYFTNIEQGRKIFENYKVYLDNKFFKEVKVKKIKTTNSNFRKMENRVLNAMQDITDIAYRMDYTGIRFLTGTDLLTKQTFSNRGELIHTILINFRNSDTIEEYMNFAIRIANDLISDIIKSTDNLDKKWTVAYLEDLVHFKRVLLKGLLELQCEPLQDLGTEEVPF